MITRDHDRTDAGAFWPGPPPRAPRRAADRSCRSGQRRPGPVRCVRRAARCAGRARPPLIHRAATPRVRNASPVSAIVDRRISARRSAVNGRRPSPITSSLHRVRSTSGAPLVKMMPRSCCSLSRCSVVINLRADENGTSLIRGKRVSSCLGAEPCLPRGDDQRALRRIAVHQPPSTTFARRWRCWRDRPPPVRVRARSAAFPRAVRLRPPGRLLPAHTPSPRTSPVRSP